MKKAFGKLGISSKKPKDEVPPNAPSPSGDYPQSQPQQQRYEQQEQQGYISGGSAAQPSRQSAELDDYGAQHDE